MTTPPSAAALLPAVFPSVKPLPHTDFAVFKIHLLIAMAAYSLLTIASLHVLLMTLIESAQSGSVKVLTGDGCLL